MDNFAKLILGMEGLFFIIVIVLIIYLIVRRLRIKEQEDFEKRDN